MELTVANGNCIGINCRAIKYKTLKIMGSTFGGRFNAGRVYRRLGFAAT